jgi:hypothetical protein
MGYRSDVILALTDKNMKKMIGAINDSILIELLNNVDRHEKDGWTLIHWSDVKWYDDYKDVQAVNQFVASLEDSEDPEENEGFSYHIMGEEDDDYTQKGTYETPFEIRLSRSLDFFT